MSRGYSCQDLLRGCRTKRLTHRPGPGKMNLSVFGTRRKRRVVNRARKYIPLAVLIVFSGIGIASQPPPQNPPSIQPSTVFEISEPVNFLTLHPDGNTIATRQFGEGLRLTETYTGSLLRSFRTPGFSANSISFSHS